MIWRFCLCKTYQIYLRCSRKTSLADAQVPGDLPTWEASEYFGPEKSKSNRIHFLVWLPPVNGEFHWSNLFNTDHAAEERFPQPLHWFLVPTLRLLLNVTTMQVLDFDAVSVSSHSSEPALAAFKHVLKEEYNQPTSPAEKLFDMATGMRLPYSAIVASHIFQYRWQKYLFPISSFTDIDNTYFFTNLSSGHSIGQSFASKLQTGAWDFTCLIQTWHN